jgi:hypothetical protein
MKQGGLLILGAIAGAIFTGWFTVSTPVQAQTLTPPSLPGANSAVIISKGIMDHRERVEVMTRQTIVGFTCLPGANDQASPLCFVASR